MSEELTKKADVLELMASKYNLGEKAFLETLKGTIMKPNKDGKSATEAEVKAFLMVANQYNLNPFTREIHAFPDNRAGIIPVVGVDGFMSIANRDKNYNGYDLIWSDEETELKEAKPCPKWCEIKVYHKKREHPTVIREYFDEVYQSPRGAYKIRGPWQSHTKRMLRHKTIIQGFRMAFGLSGIYDEDEAVRIVDAKVVSESDSAIGKPDVEMPKEIDAPPEVKTKKSPTHISMDEQAKQDEERARVITKSFDKCNTIDELNIQSKIFSAETSRLLPELEASIINVYKTKKEQIKSDLETEKVDE